MFPGDEDTEMTTLARHASSSSSCSTRDSDSEYSLHSTMMTTTVSNVNVGTFLRFFQHKHKDKTKKKEKLKKVDKSLSYQVQDLAAPIKFSKATSFFNIKKKDEGNSTAHIKKKKIEKEASNKDINIKEKLIDQLDLSNESFGCNTELQPFQIKQILPSERNKFKEYNNLEPLEPNKYKKLGKPEEEKLQKKCKCVNCKKKAGNSEESSSEDYDSDDSVETKSSKSTSSEDESIDDNVSINTKASCPKVRATKKVSKCRMREGYTPPKIIRKPLMSLDMGTQTNSLEMLESYRNKRKVNNKSMATSISANIHPPRNLGAECNVPKIPSLNTIYKGLKLPFKEGQQKFLEPYVNRKRTVRSDGSHRGSRYPIEYSRRKSFDCSLNYDEIDRNNTKNERPRSKSHKLVSDQSTMPSLVLIVQDLKTSFFEHYNDFQMTSSKRKIMPKKRNFKEEAVQIISPILSSLQTVKEPLGLNLKLKKNKRPRTDAK